MAASSQQSPMNTGRELTLGAPPEGDSCAHLGGCKAKDDRGPGDAFLVARVGRDLDMGSGEAGEEDYPGDSQDARVTGAQLCAWCMELHCL